MAPPFAEVAATHQRFLRLIPSLSDSEIAAASRLPGWTRGHVLAHLTDAARARARLIEHELRGEHVEMWAPGERNRIIEETAGRTASQHEQAFAESAMNLERVWSTVQDWDAYETTVFTRWRELLVHLVDLDVGVERTEWEDSFVIHVRDLFSRRLPDGSAILAGDLSRRWGTGTVVAAGGGRDLAAWLLGRESPVVGPELGGWPTY
ncbi:maleylpyruvate isomerase [Microlunatus endophyticus]|uniref:Maleylpyruvate isomerase n=1 Tax=Microlunatus endophyticus TaxID=1716077 RepID=A0A917S3P3_9ACTN|nr:maleylpyruvate isomerase family mycothiol-dependent enzyme [Microlunatus endophyticus]GGL56206.1 maleylpyruvate isomerase [Microlunatus endophyticus]